MDHLSNKSHELKLLEILYNTEKILQTEFLPAQLMWMLSSPIITCADRVLKLCTFSQKARTLTFLLHDSIYKHVLKLKENTNNCIDMTCLKPNVHFL